VSGREVPEPCVHTNVVVGEVLGPCVSGIVAVGGAPESCRSTAVGAAGMLLTSPCFRRGLRTTVVMDARGEPSLLVTGASLDGTPVLFPRTPRGVVGPSPRSGEAKTPPEAEARVGRGRDSSRGRG
jgi:hypothetical protein